MSAQRLHALRRAVLVKAMLALFAATSIGSVAKAQDSPPVISPLDVKSDDNGVNLVDGRTRIDLPVLSVPGAPRLKFDRVQNAAPYISGRITGALGETRIENVSVHTGAETSESFHCVDYDCTARTGTGSTFIPNTNVYRQGGTGAVWHFNLKQVDTTGADRSLQYYASDVIYPDGEVISYSYEISHLPDDPSFTPYYRPVKVSSSLGFFIVITYQPGEVGTSGWNTPETAAIYNSDAPSTPLDKLTYNTNGTITELDGRTFSCSGCVNSLGSKIEVTQGNSKLPGESSFALQVNPASGASIVGSVIRDGVTYSYAYTNLRFDGSINGYLYDKVTVSGPDGYHQVYDINPSLHGSTVKDMVDSIGRKTSYEWHGNFPERIVYPELNEVDVTYDNFGNITQKVTKAKPNSGFADQIEKASFPTGDLDLCGGVQNSVLCYRPQWKRDALGRQTDFLYNDSGQVIEQTDPADASGVRRKTYITYTTTGPSRRSVVRVCGATTTCGTTGEIRTEYTYWGDTFLPATERRIDAAHGVTLETTYSYDPAGRLLSVDGPLPGTDDAKYFRYDMYGRKTWEIGPLGANGVRSAKKYAYRDSDDKVTVVETGTVPDQNSAALTVLDRTDISYDGHRNPIRDKVSSSGTVYKVTDRSFTDVGNLECQTARMNLASLPADACTLGTQGTFGPDRITKNTYDAAGQLLRIEKAYNTPLAQVYAAYTYSPNGKRTSVTDANGNLAQMGYDGFDRQNKWTFPSKTAPGTVNAADYESYTYDAVNNRKSLRKRDGSTISYFYDGLNRMIRKTVPERSGLSSTHTRDVFYGYDMADHQVYARFDSATGEGVTNTWDTLGRQLSSTLKMDGVSRTLAYQYDADGNRTRLTYPDGRVITYAYDAASRMGGIYFGEGTSTFLDTFTYNPRGQVKTRTERYGSGVSYGYDAIGRLSSQADTFSGGAGNVTATFSSYNPASQILSYARNNDAYAWQGKPGSADLERSYKPNGLNQYSTVDSTVFTYDLDGDLTWDGDNSYTYDVENRLVASSGAMNAALRYDPLGRLYEVTSGSATTRFLYDGDALIAEYNGAGAMTARYVHGGDAGDDPLLWFQGATWSGSALRWLHADHQGSIVAVTAMGSGASPQINAYDEYGIPEDGGVGRFRYTGQAWLPELGMSYYKARIYAPTLGRFLQTDPVGYDDQINLYAYVENDPVNGTDPTGEQSNTCSRVGSSSCSGNYAGNGVHMAKSAAASAAHGNAGRGGDGRPLNRLDNNPPPNDPPPARSLRWYGKLTSVLGALLSLGGDSCPSCDLTLEKVLQDPGSLDKITLDQFVSRVGTPRGWVWTRNFKGRNAGKGWVLRQWGGKDYTGRYIRWHPGGGRHGPDPYWRVNNGHGDTDQIPSGGRW